MTTEEEVRGEGLKKLLTTVAGNCYKTGVKDGTELVIKLLDAHGIDDDKLNQLRQEAGPFIERAGVEVVAEVKVQGGKAEGFFGVRHIQNEVKVQYEPKVTSEDITKYN